MGVEERRLLRELREQARRLADAEAILGEDFHDWLKRAAAILEKGCGSDSDLVREFKLIRYELDEQLLKAAQRMIEGAIGSVPMAGANVPLREAQKRCYQQGLEKAAEVLLAAELCS